MELHQKQISWVLASNVSDLGQCSILGTYLDNDIASVMMNIPEYQLLV